MKFLSMIALTFLISPIASAGELRDVTISMLMVDTFSTKTNKLFIKTDKPRTADKPSCQTSGWHYVLPLESEQQERMFSILLAAKMSGATLNLFGNNNCESRPDLETLHRIELK